MILEEKSHVSIKEMPNNGAIILCKAVGQAITLLA